MVDTRWRECDGEHAGRLKWGLRLEYLGGATPLVRSDCDDVTDKVQMHGSETVWKGDPIVDVDGDES